MAEIDFTSLPKARKGKLDALFALAGARLDELSRRDRQIVSLAIVGSKHADGVGGGDDGDCIAADVFRTISDLAGDAHRSKTCGRR